MRERVLIKEVVLKTTVFELPSLLGSAWKWTCPLCYSGLWLATDKNYVFIQIKAHLRDGHNVARRVKIKVKTLKEL